jgi:hypothetical protein
MKTTPSGNGAPHSLGTYFRLGAISSVATLLLVSSSASAEEANAADTAAARDLAIEGIKLADADRCAQAVDKLSRAEKLRHSAIVLGRLGECLIEVGKIVDGTEDLQRLLHEPLPPNPPANLVRARERAQTALDAAKPNLSYLAISVRGPTENVAVTVDGQPMSSLLLDRERPTDPGEHLIEASAPGYTKASRRLTIGAGEKQEVTLKLAVDPQAAAPRPAASSPAPTEVNSEKPAVAPPVQATTSNSGPEAASSSGSRMLSYVLMGAGTAVLAGGGVFGYLALNEKKDLDGKCPNNVCVSSSKGTLDSANRDATISTILVGSGAAALAVGAVLFFTSGPSRSEEHPPVAFHPRAYVGLGQVGVVSAF